MITTTGFQNRHYKMNPGFSHHPYQSYHHHRSHTHHHPSHLHSHPHTHHQHTCCHRQQEVVIAELPAGTFQNHQNHSREVTALSSTSSSSSSTSPSSSSPTTSPPSSPIADSSHVHRSKSHPSDDKISIISTENIRKFAVVTSINQRKEEREIGEEKSSQEKRLAHSDFIRKWINVIAFADLILFIVSIILCIITEKYICHYGAVRLSSEVSRWNFEGDGSATGVVGITTEKNANNSLQVVPVKQLQSYYLVHDHQHYCISTAFEYLRDNLLGKLERESPFKYHAVVIMLLALVMCYLVLEVWLFCVLIKITKSPRISFSIKWLSYRSLILTCILLVTLHDAAYTGQATCSEIVLLPMQVVRMVIGGVPVLWLIWNGRRSHWIGKCGGGCDDKNSAFGTAMSKW